MCKYTHVFKNMVASMHAQLSIGFILSKCMEQIKAHGM